MSTESAAICSCCGQESRLNMHGSSGFAAAVDVSWRLEFSCTVSSEHVAVVAAG
jgi:hypothetical protein